MSDDDVAGEVCVVLMVFVVFYSAILTAIYFLNRVQQ